MTLTKEQRNENARKYYQTHKKQVKSKKKAYYQAHKEQIKEYYQANKDKCKEQIKEYYQEHKEQIKEYRQTHKEQAKAYYQAHKEQRKASMKAWQASNKDKLKAYTKSDLNSLGQTKHSIRCKSQRIIKKSGIKIPGYENHHCFGYDDPSKFIYCSKETHLKIHQFLRDNNIDADSNHYEQIKHLLDESVIVFGV